MRTTLSSRSLARCVAQIHGELFAYLDLCSNLLQEMKVNSPSYDIIVRYLGDYSM